jgi:hypothetical protein
VHNSTRILLRLIAAGAAAMRLTKREFLRLIAAVAGLINFSTDFGNGK